MVFAHPPRTDFGPPVIGMDPAWTTILILDDEPDVLDSLRSFILENMGFVTVLVEANVHKALDVLKNKHVDAVLVDYRMGGTSGAEFIRLARNIAPQATFALVSGYPADLVPELSAISGLVDRIFLKPLETEPFLAYVRSAAGLPARHRPSRNG